MTALHKIFAFGYMGSGKDEFARHTEDRHNFASYALADGIRDYIRFRDDSYVPKSNRGLEIDVGNKHREWFGRDIWCRAAHAKAQSDPMNKWRAGVIIRDGRFTHEYDYFVNQRGYIPVHIASTGVNRYERLVERDGRVNDVQFRDPRDCEIAHYPAIEIANNGTLAEFHAAIDEFAARLLAGEIRWEVAA